MAPHVLIDADHRDTVEPGRVIDQGTLPLGQDGIVGGVPRYAEALGDAGHGQVLDDDADQAPTQAGTGDLGPRFGRGGGVLTPHVRALDAPVATHGDEQRGGAPAERDVCEPPGHRVARYAMAPAPPAPVVRL